MARFLPICAALLALLPGPARAQTAPSDSARVGLPDPTEALPPPQPPAPTGEGGLEHPVAFSAADSLVIAFADSTEGGDGDVATLYGEARADYNGAALNAYAIELLFEREELRARGLERDTALVGRPAFESADGAFTGRELAYSLQSERGRVVGARTVIEDGYLLGGVVKQVGPHVTYVADGAYTTCSYEDHPHYDLRAGKMKIVDGEWVYTGPARLYILGVPTPLWLPFGFFPAAEGRRSGPLPPQYGEDPDLGFYLKNLGWYWAISEYMDLQVGGGLYSRGSFEVNPLFRYARRYYYSGNLQVGFARLRQGEAQDPGAGVRQAISVRWAHDQKLDAAGTASLNGNVDLSSTSYLRAVSDQFDDRVTQQTQSTVNFRKSWRRAGRSLSVNLRQNQNLSTGSATLTLPRLQFSQSALKPFYDRGDARDRWYEEISIAYTG
ncbi:MAG: putative LPS assembly protein LptD, partial [Rhodothermales bacterium]|nr:putative LPS assembly protein LptD [Rhodothermales bacterium]